ncbi:MAG: transporter substrate-binding protein [Thermomicrobiales bacterium]|jgi:ribose transport system substrate-binding protein|nr:transporter substrate-binding protein [Thermomicrobiales bacterium]MDF3018041.1 transporter substrate-binding protein [Thermomicrobiales bacterium]
MRSGRCTRRSFVSRSAALATAVATAGQVRADVFAQGATPAVPDVGPLKVGWSTIYTTPSWMTETQNEIEAEIERLRSLGMEIDFQVFDANGDTATQIAQIQTMIDQAFDIVLLIAGSSTALDQVVAQAHEAGLIVVNWDSLVTTDQLTAKVNTDQDQWGQMTAQWLVDELGGSGRILAINGPAGISVSEARWGGAKKVFDQNPGVEIVGTANIEYNEAPALTEMASLLAAHPDVNGIWHQAGAHASASLKTLQQMGLQLIPMTGENFNAYLKQWCDLLDEGFTSFATAQVNYMAVISLDLAIQAKAGQETPAYVNVPLPMITDENVCEWASDELPDDWYAIPEVPGPEEVDKIIADALAAEQSGMATPAATPAA